MTRRVCRRRVIQILGSGATVAIAGCNAFQSDGSQQAESTPSSLSPRETATDTQSSSQTPETATPTESTTEVEKTDEPDADAGFVEENLAKKLDVAGTVDGVLTYAALDDANKKFITHGDDQHRPFHDLNFEFWTVDGDLVYQAIEKREDGLSAVIVRGGTVARDGRIQDISNDSILARTYDDEEGNLVFNDDGERLSYDGYDHVVDAQYVSDGVAAVARGSDDRDALFVDGEVVREANIISALYSVGGEPVYVVTGDRPERRSRLERSGTTVAPDLWEDNTFGLARVYDIGGNLAFVAQKMQRKIEDENRSSVQVLWYDGDIIARHERILDVVQVDGTLAYFFSDYDEPGIRLVYGGDEIGAEYRTVDGITSIGGDIAYKAKLPVEERAENEEYVVVYRGTEIGPYYYVASLFEYGDGLAFVAQHDEDEFFTSRKLHRER